MSEICFAEMVIQSNSVSFPDLKHQTCGLVKYEIVLSVAKMSLNNSLLVVYWISPLDTEWIQSNSALASP